MRTYRELFAVRELSALFASSSLRSAASTMSGLALASVVFGRTGSPLLSAVAMFGSSFAQALGAATLLSAADRVPPRRALGALGALFAIATLAYAAPGIPIWALLLLQLCTGLASAAGGGVQWGFLDEIVPGGYILARSLFNISVGVTQIAGFALGGVLIAFASPRGVFLIAALLHLLSSSCIRFGLAARPPRAAGRASIRETWTVNAQLWSSTPRRAVLVALWVPNGLVVGCEALFVPFDPRDAGALFVAAALGMLAGDVSLGRVVPTRLRRRLIGPLRLLLAAPYVLFALHPPLVVAVVAVAAASFGYSASLLLQERLLDLTPPTIRGQTLGLIGAGMLTMQAVGATVAGLVAEHLSTATSMTVMAVASVATTVAITPLLDREPASARPTRNPFEEVHDHA